MLAAVLAPGLALAAGSAITPQRVTMTVKPFATVNLTQLAGSAANAAALKAHSGFKLAMPVHRFPTADGKQRPPSLLRLNQANVAVAGNAVINQPGGGFNGTYEGTNSVAIGGDLEPPDQGLAVNNGTIVEDVNDSVQIFNAAGTSLMGPISNWTFFGLDPNTTSIGDPHVEYDASSKRWFFDTYLASATFNGFVLAVSTTSNPAGSYTVYQIDDIGSQISACQGSCFGDYPQPGYDANAYYIDADLFSNTTGNFIDAGIYAFPKPALLAGASFTYDVYLVPDFVVEPAIPAAPGKFATEAGGTEFFMSATNILYGTTDIDVFSLSNTAAIGTTTPPTLYGTRVATETYTGTVPSTEPNNVGPYGISVGATTSPQLDGGYNAFGSGVKFLNNALYAGLTTGTTDGNGLPRDVIAWFNVQAKATGTATQARIAAQGYIVPPNGYSISYPGFALNAKGNGLIGTTITNPNAAVIGGYPSAGFVQFTNGAPATNYRVTGQGATSDDGFTGYPGAGPAGVGRWGDFASATTDPITGKFYVGNEYIPDPLTYPRSTYANWGTFITQEP